MQQEDVKAKWYVVHTYSGHENKVKATIEKSVQNRGIEEIIQEVSVPEEKVHIKTKDGKDRERTRKIFPGYCFVKMIVTDDSWYIVRNTKGVTGFVGPNSKPVPLSNEEVYNLGLEKEVKKVYSVDYEVGDSVIVQKGPFEGHSGIVRDINLEKGIAKVSIFMFADRETSMDINVTDIEKI